MTTDPDPLPVPGMDKKHCTLIAAALWILVLVGLVLDRTEGSAERNIASKAVHVQK